MANEYVVAVDTGTTSMRALLYSPDGRVLAMQQRHNPPDYLPEGRVEQDAGSWRDALVFLLSGMAEKAASLGIDIGALSLTGIRSTVMPVAADGTALAPAIMWQDLRTEPLCTLLRPQEDAIYRRTGLPLTSVFSALKMRWLVDNKPDLVARTYRFAGIQDYLIFQLTGRWVTDRCLASRTNLYDLQTRDWSDELLKVFDVPRRLVCDLVDPGSIAGTLREDIAAITGLPAGIPVISAGGDQQCAALGMGLVCAGDTIVSTGTGAYVMSLTEKPLFDPQRRVFCNLSAMPSLHVLEASTPAAGVVFRWFAEGMYRPSGGAEAVRQSGKGTSSGVAVPGDMFAVMNTDIASAAPGAGGLVFLPHFTGAGAPYWNPEARGVFFGLTLSTSRADMARAVLEGIAAEMARNVMVLRSFASLDGRVLASGGLTRSPLFAKMLASMTGQPVSMASSAEATAAGAWIGAAVALGLYPGHAAAHAALTAAAALDGDVGSAGAPRPAAGTPQPSGTGFTPGSGAQTLAACSDAGTVVMPDPALVPVYAELMERRAALYDTLYRAR